MKIFEIIAESHTLNEETGWTALFKVMREVIVAAKAGKATYKELGHSWARAAYETGSDIESVISIGVKEAEKVGLDSSVIKAAQKEARAIYKADTKAASEYSKALKPAPIPPGSIDWINRTATAYQIYEPFKTYLENKAALDEQLSSGQINQTEYNQRLKIEKGYLVTNLVTAWAGNKIINVLGKGASSLGNGTLKFFGTVLTGRSYSRFARMISKLETAGSIAKAGAKVGLSYFLTEPEVRKLIAELLSTELLEKIGGASEWILDELDKLSEQYLGTEPGFVPGSTGRRDDDQGAELDMSPSTAPPKYPWKPDTYIPPGFKRGPDNTLVPTTVDMSQYYNQRRSN